MLASNINYYGVLELHDNNNDEILRAAEEISNLGYSVIDSGYTATEVEEIGKVFEIVHSKYVNKYGNAFLSERDELNGVRLPLMFDTLFLDLALNSVITSLVQHLIKGKFYLNQQNAIINPPGKRYNQDAFHRDLPYQHFISSRPLAINALFCVDEFNQFNGATNVIPCSQKSEKYPSDEYVKKHSTLVEAPAGSFIILDCMLFHKGSFNTTDKPRRAVNHVYTIPYLKQQINIPNTLGHVSTLNNTQRELLGYDYQVATNIDEYLKSRSIG